VRLFARLFFAAALGSLPVGLAAVSCGTDAVGVDACHKIESARCAVAPLCMPGFDVDRCTRFYRDECLVGIQNAAEGGPDPNTLAQPCVDAIHAAAACVDAGASAACQALIPNVACPEANATATACNVILHCPEVLSACGFVASPPEAGTEGTGGDAQGTGDAAPE